MTIPKKPALIIRIVLLLGLVIGMVVIWKKYPPSKIADTVSTKISNQSTRQSFSTLSDSANAALKIEVSGYWQRIEPEQLPDKPYSISDRIELKTNGIFWQVHTLTLRLPGGDTATYTHIQTGYLNPFKLTGNDSSTILIDALTSSQVFAGAVDTCYIPSLATALRKQSSLLGMSQEVFAKSLRRSADTLFIDGRAYTGYDTTTHPLADFFPRGSTELVDKVSLSECSQKASFADFAVNMLQQTFSSGKSAGATDTAAIRSLLTRYYSPIVVAELARHYTIGLLEPMHGTLTYTITVGADGKVTNVKKNAARSVSSEFEQLLTASIKGWYFMPVAGSSQPRTVKITFTI